MIAREFAIVRLQDVSDQAASEAESSLDRFGREGWRVAGVAPQFILLEREYDEEGQADPDALEGLRTASAGTRLAWFLSVGQFLAPAAPYALHCSEFSGQEWGEPEASFSGDSVAAVVSEAHKWLEVRKARSRAEAIEL